MSTSPQKPRASQDQRSQATRERLIAATIECIAAKGLPHATTAEISERAGVSSGARVHHFKSKMDLVNAAICFTYEQATVESLGTATVLQRPSGAAFMVIISRPRRGGRGRPAPHRHVPKPLP